MSKVVVGMSGGVDSAVTAYLLKIAGYDVVGVTLRTWISEDGEDSRCCKIDDARRVAWELGIPYHVMTCIAEFRTSVTEPFVQEYTEGRTPNPCIICNRDVKWAKMLYAAEVMQADYVATGHYASIIHLPNGRYTVQKGQYANKDQSYMLYQLTQEQLQKTLMPLGRLSKVEVREIAAKAGLPVAETPDSQEICFVTDGHYADYIEQHAGGELPEGGNFVDEQGTVLGKHRGIIHYTVGQRKGLGLALGYPAYVKEIRPETNEVVISGEDGLYHDSIICDHLNYLSIPEIKPGEHCPAYVKIRYHHEAVPAEAELIGEDRLQIRFLQPVRAAALGQSAVMYDENGYVIGGGVITR